MAQQWHRVEEPARSSQVQKTCALRQIVRNAPADEIDSAALGREIAYITTVHESETEC